MNYNNVNVAYRLAFRPPKSAILTDLRQHFPRSSEMQAAIGRSEAKTAIGVVKKRLSLGVERSREGPAWVISSDDFSSDKNTNSSITLNWSSKHKRRIAIRLCP